MNAFHLLALVLRWFSHPLYVMESGMIGFALVVALTAPWLGEEFFRRVERLGDSIARRRSLSVVGIGLIAFLGRLALVPLLPTPTPRYHDEFSHLLLGKTLAAGRLANPTHPMWRHFETFHVIQKPTYASIYPLAQGMLLAIGQHTSGLPLLGIWIAGGVMAGALCWMLQGWLPPGWALLGSVLAVIRLVYLTYWTNSYWGGLHGVIGGALVLGALPRLRRTQRFGDALLFALGVVILANSRPYEGCILSVIAGATLLWSLWRLGQPRTAARVLAPIATVLVIAAAGMTFYFHAVTGSAIRMPYTAGLTTYALAPQFLFQAPYPEPHYRYAEMRRFYEDEELATYRQMRTWRGYLVRAEVKLNTLFTFFLGPALTLPFLLIPWHWRDRRTRFLLITGLLMALAMSVEVWFFPHYFSPTLPVLWALLLQSMRHLRQWRWRNKPAGAFLVRAIPAACFLMFAVQVGALAAGHHFPRTLWCCTEGADTARAEIQKTLQAIPGKHLVIVRYSDHHNVDREWVYNEPDIDGAPVVWAREMSRDEDAELLKYFHDRDVWLVEPDVQPARLIPYGAGAH